MTRLKIAQALVVATWCLLLTPSEGWGIGTIMTEAKSGSDNKPAAEASGSGTRSPQVGQVAPDIKWTDAKGKKHALMEMTKQSKVVLLVLRGWPGYQCGICNRQVAQFIGQKEKFESMGAQVVMIYPGPAELLVDHAKQFQGDRVFEGAFHYVIDPGYGFTNAWNLRWDAPRETAYPATYILGEGNKVEFANVSKTHGGRVKAGRVLKELAKSSAAMNGSQQKGSTEKGSAAK